MLLKFRWYFFVILALNGCSAVYNQEEINDQIQDNTQNQVSYTSQGTIQADEYFFDDELNELVNPIIDKKLKQIIKNSLNSNASIINALINLQTKIEESKKYGLTRDLLFGVSSSYRQAKSNTYSDTLAKVISSESKSADFGLTLSWELDIWGKISDQQKIYHLELKTQYQDYIALRASMLSNIIKSWLGLITQKIKVKQTKEKLSSFEKSYQIENANFEQGVSVSSANLLLLESQILSLKSNLINLEYGFNNQIRTLKNLLGLKINELPHLLNLIPATFPNLKSVQYDKIPIKHLFNRYDIKSAKTALRNSYHNANLVYKSKYPSLSLSAFWGIGLSNISGFGQLFSEKPESGNATLSFKSPIFPSTDTKFNILSSTQAIEIQQNNFNQKIYEANREIEDYVENETVLNQLEKNLKNKQQIDNKYLELKLFQYQSGISDLSNYLTKERELIDANNNLVDLQMNLLNNRVNLYLAIGGIYEFFELTEQEKEYFDQINSEK